MGLFRFRKKKDSSSNSEKEQSNSGGKTNSRSQGQLVKVHHIDHNTPDGVVVSFDIAGMNFNPVAGQYINLTATINGEEIIRSYSLCSKVDAQYPAIGVKKINGGKMSSYLKDVIQVGDEIQISEPQGNFKLESNASGKYIGIVAGSGITPVQSMIETTIANASWKVYYGNKTEQQILFKDRLNELKGSQLEVTHFLSQDDAVGYHQGRISAERIESFLSENEFEGLFLCGPEELIEAGIEVAEKLNIDQSKVHYELFTTPVSLGKEKASAKSSDFSGEADCKVIIDGDEYDIKLKADEIMMDAFERQGVDAPFSCKGAVCCTCRAKVTSGSADMVMNYSLCEEEVGEGYVLTCQAKATSSSLTVDFDE